MKNKPIDAKLVGCDCSQIPQNILTDNQIFFPGGMHLLMLTIDKENHDFDSDNGIVLSEIEEMYKDKLQNCKYADLFHLTPLHDERWELNLEDRKWYLVNQGSGYA
jgi:hypothetical protein